MNYIIDPVWFYWIEVVNNLKNACFTILVVSGIIAGVMIITGSIMYAVSATYGPNDNEYKASLRILHLVKIPFIIFIAAALMSVFIPSRAALVEMQVARFATYENAEWTVEAVKSAVDYVVNAIQTVNGG